MFKAKFNHTIVNNYNILLGKKVMRKNTENVSNEK